MLVGSQSIRPIESSFLFLCPLRWIGVFDTSHNFRSLQYIWSNLISNTREKHPHMSEYPSSPSQCLLPGSVLPSDPRLARQSRGRKAVLSRIGPSFRPLAQLAKRLQGVQKGPKLLHLAELLAAWLFFLRQTQPILWSFSQVHWIRTLFGERDALSG